MQEPHTPPVASDSVVTPSPAYAATSALIFESLAELFHLVNELERLNSALNDRVTELEAAA